MAKKLLALLMTRAQPLLSLLGGAAVAVMLQACDGAAVPSAVTPPAGGGTATDGGERTAVTAPLLGPWRLVSLQPAGGPVVPVPASLVFTAEFGSDQRVSAVVDCNRCTSHYSATADALAVGPTMACTRAWCPASAPDDETFTAILTSSVAWRVQGASLELRGEQGALSFTR